MMLRVLQVCVVLVACIVALCPRHTQAKTVTGSLDGTAKFEYLAKFCFDYGEQGPWGYVNGTIVTSQDDVMLFFFNDQDDSWPTVSSSDVSCAAKVNSSAVRMVVPVMTGGANGQSTFTFSRVVPVLSDPQFWYIAAATKDCAFDVQISSYTFNFVNPGPTLFSVDEFGMSDMYILFGLMMTLLAVTHVVSHVKFQYWPTSVKLFSASLVLRAVSLACGAIHFCALGINGTGSPFFESVGTCVGIVASFSAFVWAGWIATGGLNSARPGLTTLAVAFLILNFCSYVGLFAWYELGRAPWSTDYVFDSGFGVCVVICTLLYGGWWLWQLQLTYKRERLAARRMFYFRFGLFIGTIFCIQALVVALGAIVPDYERRRVVYSLRLLCLLGSNTAAVYLQHPVIARKHGFGMSLGGVQLDPSLAPDRPAQPADGDDEIYAAL